MKLLSAVSALLLAAWTPAFAATSRLPPRRASARRWRSTSSTSTSTRPTRSGHRITGLGKDDFELLEDGKRVAISNFEAVVRLLQAAPQRPAPRSAPAAPAAAERAPEDALNLVVYFDDFNIRPAHRARVLKQLGEFLPTSSRPATG